MSCQVKPIVAIETSCDETAVAVYQLGEGLLSQALFSQVELHALYGGVVPELAARDHVARLPELFQKALADAKVQVGDIGGVAYTAGPGLVGAVMTGASFGRSVAQTLGVSEVPVHHLEGHILSVLLDETIELRPFPWLTLLVSGGHTLLIRVDGWGRYSVIGESIDDAVGEAFDKAAMVLGFDYPGGRALAELAVSGDESAVRFARPMLAKGSLDFSFSGLKTAFATRHKKMQHSNEDLAASYQAAIVDVLVKKVLLACEVVSPNMLVLAGGVAANHRLREELAAIRGVKVVAPAMAYCTDNAAMIAVAGSLRLAGGGVEPVSGVRARWDLSELSGFAVESQFFALD